MLFLTVYAGLLWLGNIVAGEIHLSIHPSQGIIHLGHKKTFICKVEGGDVDTITWVLPSGEILEDGDQQENVKVTVSEYNAQLEVTASTMQVEGTYKCRSIGESEEDLENHVTISVIQDPIFQPFTMFQEFTEGSDAVVQCNVVGIPTPTMTWMYNQREITPSEHYQFQDNGYLKIQNIQPSDAGTYQCVGKIESRNVENVCDIMVNVRYAPRFVREGPQILYSWLGNPVHISCAVQSHPQANMTWSHNGTDLDATAQNSSIVLEVRLDSMDQFSEYVCTAVNALGKVSQSVSLREAGIPGSPQNLTAVPLSSGINVSFSRPEDDGGIPNLTFQLEWRQNSNQEWSRMKIDQEHYWIRKLEPYTMYMLRVAAINGKGMGAFSNTTLARTLSLRGEPDRPKVTSEMEEISNSIWIFFKDSESDGSKVLRHIISFKEVHDEKWNNVTVNGSDSYLLEGLNWASTYEVKIQAENSFGRSQSTYLNVRTLQRAPAAAVE
ncbi:neural cell adhesion molecule 1-like isoform X2 [Narcine bancroftii]|uniref:neural cell adhesion molecule 1-like isoform X2 n=1 Tax=Narcine bancroftii TaxID=1343680 RepID=UPI003831D3CE